jgi:hypothetical protein
MGAFVIPRAFRSFSHRAAALGLLVVGLACGVGERDAGNSGVPGTGVASPQPNEAELIEQLSAIGYVAGTQQVTRSAGVARHDPGRAAPGLNLFTSGHGPVALLMDMEGVVLHEWRAELAQVFPEQPKLEASKEPPRNFWRDARLLPNGELLVLWELYGLVKLDRDSRVLWTVPARVHHDLQINAHGEIAHLQAERRMIPGIPAKKAIEDFIVVRDAGGRELRRLAMSDALRNARWPGLRKAFWARGKERGYGLDEKNIYDPFHTNSLWLLSEDEATRLGASFSPGDALVSMAMLDTIAILDMEKGVTRWSQQGPFGMQHGPRPTRDGKIILFNNFLTKERSSVLTLDPTTRRVVAEYTGPESEPLYSRRSGRVQVLQNGNFLVVETERGRALEVAPNGDEVWEFRSPFRTPESKDKVASLYSLERVDTSHASWLGSR